MRKIIIQNSIVIEILDILYPSGAPDPSIDPGDESLSVVTSDNPNIEVGWSYINGAFIQN